MSNIFNFNSMIVILDNGHGVNTPGKCSPDNRLKEYSYTREIVQGIKQELDKHNIENVVLVPEEVDIPLNERVKRANEIYEKRKDAILISVHCNAFGNDGKWHSANGWSVFVELNPSNDSIKLADSIQEQTSGLKVRFQYPGKSYWVQSLAICRDTKCPAVLTENLFQDNKEDVDYLLSNEGKKKIIDLHVKGILKYGNIR